MVAARKHAGCAWCNNAVPAVLALPRRLEEGFCCVPQLCLRQVLDVLGQPPLVPGRIFDASAAISPELIRQRHDDFGAAQKFKARYSSFGFSDKANLDEGTVWPVAFALKQLTADDEARLGALVTKAVG